MAQHKFSILLLLLVLMPFAYSFDLSLNQTAAFHLEEESGTTADNAVPDKNDGIIKQALMGFRETGVSGYAYKFAGGAIDTEIIWTNTNYGLTNTRGTVCAYAYFPNATMSGAIAEIGNIGSAGDKGYSFGVGDGTFGTDGNEYVALINGVRWVDINHNIGIGWHFLCTVMGYDSNIAFYKDGLYVGNVTGTGANAYANNMSIGNVMTVSGRSFGSIIDEIYVYNDSKSAAFILELNNSFYPYGSGDVIVASGAVFNESISELRSAPKSEPKIFQKFYFGGNFTVNGAFSPAGSCYFNATNVSAVFDYPSNKTINISSSVQLNYSLSESNISLTYDTIIFSACKYASNPYLDIYGNGILLYSVASDLLPICPDNSLFVKNTYLLGKYENITINISCPNCADNKKISLIYQSGYTHFDSMFRIMRKLSFHKETLSDYMSYYAYKSHFYAYDTNQTTSFYMNCNNSLAESVNSLKIYGWSPNISLDRINDVRFADSRYVNASYSYNFTYAAYSSLSYFQANISFNGTLINASNELYLSLTSSALNRSGWYNISAYSINQYGSFSYSAYFLINDSTVPYILILKPSGSYGLNELINFSADVYDPNLYAVNFTVYAKNGSMLLSSEITGLSETKYKVNFSMFISTAGDYNFTVIGADSHTGESISAMKISGKENEIIYNDNIKISAPEALLLTTAKKTDRYTLNADFPKGAKKEFILESNCALDLIENSPYTAHFVDFYCSKLWIDFEGARINPQIIQEADNRYRIVFDTDETSLKFNSIGGINIGQESVIFTVSAPYNEYDSDVIRDTKWYNMDAFNSSTTSGVLLYFLLFCLLVFLVGLGFYTGIPIIIILAGLFGFFFSMLVFAKLSAVAGGIFIFFSLILIVMAVVYAKD